MTTLQDQIPLHTIFIFFLIISANYLGQLYPCKIQEVFSNNIYLKHFFGYLTLLFFVLLAEPNIASSFSNTISKSFLLYMIFLVLMNTNVLFFICAISSLAIIYLISIKKNDTSTPVSHYIWYNHVNDALYITFGIFIVIGFLIYMGEKKIEYKNKFNYLTFVFGKPICKGFSPKTKYIDSLFAAFT
jgi:hypothetical protein